MSQTAEQERLLAHHQRRANWRNWGPYLSERAWGTVREDYSEHGTAWDYFPHDHARSRAYRWNEDGLGGISDRQQFLCFALSLWNGRDPILKERLFGLTGPEGNHGEDVKEAYFYLDSAPTHSTMKMLYKYPQAAFPYGELVAENGRRGRHDPEYELWDTGVLANGRYFDITIEYAKAAESDILIRLSAANRGPEAAELTLLPTLWFRNTWSWGYKNGPMGDVPGKPRLWADGATRIVADHPALGRYTLHAENPAALFFTENETNNERLFSPPNATPYVKDAFHRYVIQGETGTVNPAQTGTKAAAHYQLTIPAGQTAVIRLRLISNVTTSTPFTNFDALFSQRLAETDDFYAAIQPASLSADEKRIQRQAWAGLLWSKQMYYYDVEQWLHGDPAGTSPPPPRKNGRNHNWTHLNNFDIISMPDKWEYPWYAAWDLAFHALPLAQIDPDFAKRQLILMTREWYMHPNGQLPAYEWAFGDVNPPLHAWAAWRVYQMDAAQNGRADRPFLEAVFHKLLLNFTWWVNRKDEDGRNVFQGGFLGLDNISLFDRSATLPTGGHIDQADGTAWMGFFSLTMLRIALELARENPVYQDLATKFFEHFLAIATAMSRGFGGKGLWDEQDGFYYDVLYLPDGSFHPLKVRSLVGLMPLIAVEVLDAEMLAQMPDFQRRMAWFLQNRPHLSGNIMCSLDEISGQERHIVDIVTPERLRRVLGYLLDENEFLSPYGIRSLSKIHQTPYRVHLGGQTFHIAYEPGESQSTLFGGNSNWRGPIWFPINYLLIESLHKHYQYYGGEFKVAFPTGSGNLLNLKEIATELTKRLVGLFLPDGQGQRPYAAPIPPFQQDPHWRDLILFHEYFHGDSGAGLGASHQTGWTGLVSSLLQDFTP
ncbi:MAG TPA: glucosidase [Chloroflexota bacterium]|nr:glucosidase [Chloroflexota bacterium]HUM67290.1 glucosidase [Chloroflexota bacterium]